MAQQQNQNRGGGQRDEDAGSAQNRPTDEANQMPGRGSEAEGQDVQGDLGAAGDDMGGAGRTAGMGGVDAEGSAGGAIGSPRSAGALGQDEPGMPGAGHEGLAGLSPGEDATGLGGTSDVGVGGTDAEGLAALDDEEEGAETEEGTDPHDQDEDDVIGGGG